MVRAVLSRYMPGQFEAACASIAEKAGTRDIVVVLDALDPTRVYGQSREVFLERGLQGGPGGWLREVLSKPAEDLSEHGFSGLWVVVSRDGVPTHCVQCQVPRPGGRRA